MMYELTMTKNQTAIVRNAAGEYGDLRINKWNAFVNDVGRSTDKHIQKQALNVIRLCVQHGESQLRPARMKWSVRLP